MKISIEIYINPSVKGGITCLKERFPTSGNDRDLAIFSVVIPACPESLFFIPS